jgi:putative transposase
MSYASSKPAPTCGCRSSGLSSELHNFHWQNGYGAFSVSQSGIEDVRDYIRRQREHHRVLTFQDEYRKFLLKHGIEFDERYVWD